MSRGKGRTLDFSMPTLHLDELGGEKRLIAKVRYSSIDGVCHRDYALWELVKDGKKYYAVTTSVSLPGFESPALVWGLGHTPGEALYMAYLFMINSAEDAVVEWEVMHVFDRFYDELRGEES